VILGIVAALVADAVTERYDPTLAIIMYVCDAGLPAVLAVVLVLVIVFGGDDRSDRIFRLLRWLKGQPEPLGPPEPPVKPGTLRRKPRQRPGKQTRRKVRQKSDQGRERRDTTGHNGPRP
jgi:hypothetical protein